MPPTGRSAELDRPSPAGVPGAAPAYRFSGHQTFPFRYHWFPKAAEHAQADPRLFARPDALARLGVGKNMVASIRHWCEAAGLMDFAPARRGGEARLTPLAELLFGVAAPDPQVTPPRTPNFPPPPPPEKTRAPFSPVAERR